MLTIMAVMIHFHEIMSVMRMLGIAVPELGESRDPRRSPISLVPRCRKSQEMAKLLISFRIPTNLIARPNYVRTIFYKIRRGSSTIHLSPRSEVSEIFISDRKIDYYFESWLGVGVGAPAEEISTEHATVWKCGEKVRRGGNFYRRSGFEVCSCARGSCHTSGNNCRAGPPMSNTDDPNSTTLESDTSFEIVS